MEARIISRKDIFPTLYKPPPPPPAPPPPPPLFPTPLPFPPPPPTHSPTRGLARTHALSIVTRVYNISILRVVSPPRCVSAYPRLRACAPASACGLQLNRYLFTKTVGAGSRRLEGWGMMSERRGEGARVFKVTFFCTRTHRRQWPNNNNTYHARTW